MFTSLSSDVKSIINPEKVYAVGKQGIINGKYHTKTYESSCLVYFIKYIEAYALSLSVLRHKSKNHGKLTHDYIAKE